MAEGTCSIAGCTKRVLARGWCGTHYARWRKHGDVAAHVPVANAPIRERFRAKVDFDGPVPLHNPALGPCHLWLAACTGNGYGQFRWGGQMGLAHRFIYTETFGAIPDGMQLDHLCRVRNCVNVAHLEVVTNRQNGERAKPFLVVKTRCPKGHPYSGENLWVYTKHYRNRRCRECMRQSNRDWYWRQKATA